MRLLNLRWSSEPGLSIVTLRGDLDANAVVDIRALGVVADEVPLLVIDLSELSFVDIAGLDLLEELARRPNVHIRRPTAPVVRLLERTENVIDDWQALRAALA